MKKTLTFLVILVLGFIGVFAVERSLEKIKPPIDESFADEDLFFSATRLENFGHDVRGLIADWYWVNSLQYLGNKALANPEKVNINDLRPLNPRLLYPMLDTASTLDPQFMTIYSYGAAILPAIDNQQAVKLLEKGISNNPDNWRLYHNLGFIYWQLKDYQKASEIYAVGGEKENAPIWMKQMSANMILQGGNREFALEIYRQMFETAEDEQSKNVAQLRYMQVESLIERDAIRSVLQTFQKNKGHCINSWREVFNELRNTKLKDNKALFFDDKYSPIDPLKVPYLIVNQNGQCDVEVDYKNSKIPKQ